MPNEIINKVVVGDEIIIDLDSDTLSSADQIPAGVTAHLNTGEAVEGTAEIQTSATYGIQLRDETIPIPLGGVAAYIPAGESIGVRISAENRARLIPENIAENVTILGITGTHSGGGGASEHPNPSGSSLVGGSGGSSSATATSYTVDPDVTQIANYAFYNKPSLTSVTLPTGVVSLGNYSFYGCGGLTNLDFLNNLTTNSLAVNSYSFASCSSLTTASTDKASAFGSYVFNADSALTTVSLPKAVTMGDHIFYNCTALNSVSAPLLQSIGNYGFYGCTNLREVSFPRLSTLGTYLFSSCGLTTISLPSAYAYQTSLFSNNSNLTSYSHQDSMPNASAGIATNVFQSCSNLTTADLTGLSFGSTSYDTTNQSWFSGCSSLKTVYAENANAIPKLFFQSCTQLDDVYLANGAHIWTSTTKAPVFAHGGTFIQAQTYSTTNIRIYVNTSTTVAATMTTASPTVTITIGDTTYTLSKVANSRFTISW